MIALKETDILKQIDELTPDDIVKKAVETAENSIENATEKEPADKDDKDDEEKKEEPDEEELKNAVEEAEATLDEKKQTEIEEQVAAFKAQLVKEESSPDKAAQIAADQINEMTKPKGGKKKSKGKK